MPFRPVIFADGQYAIFDDMAGFKVRSKLYLAITIFYTEILMRKIELLIFFHE